jgi:hypothetical protein
VATFQAHVYNPTLAPLVPVLKLNVANTLNDFSTTANILTENLQSIPAGTGATVAYTFQIDTSFTNGLEVELDLGAITSGYEFQVGLVDLSLTPNTKVGLNNNPPIPQVRPIGVETVNCLRYFQTWGGDEINSETIAIGAPVSATTAYFMLPLQTKMLSVPTITFSSASDWAITDFATLTTKALTGIGLASNSNGVQAVLLAGAVASGLTPGVMSMLQTNDTLDARINLSAEL